MSWARFTFVKSKLRNQRGATLVDYLMITAVVAGVGVPLMMTFFGGPINDTLYSKRQNLVSFLAQDRKEKVSNVWFNQENLGDPGKNGDLGTNRDLGNPDPGKTGNLGNPQTLKEGNPGQPGSFGTVGRLRDPGKLQEGNFGTNGGTGGAGGSGAGGAGGAASGASGSGSGGGLSNDFFSSNKKESGAPGESDAAGGGANGAYGKGGRAGSDGGGPQGDLGGSETAKQDKSKNSGDQSKGESVSMVARKKTMSDVKAAQERIDSQDGEFDWWLLVKILVFLAIIFLVVLIALGSRRR